ncbi:NDR1/HIN1-like protein 3 [Typha angustifolia]|uniref:NDR1/HIN1-like protein 3 n=1 Tax=Typha angustifolia TaxID=59011 RepID=UPI003C2FBF68
MPPFTSPQMPSTLTSPYHLQPPNATRPMKQAMHPMPRPPEFELPTRKQRLLQPNRRTNPAIWCGAILCVMFSLLLIIAGIVTLIVFLVIKPRYPSFDTTNASLNSIYIDSPAYYNGDLTFLANFSNPNHKIDVIFQYLSIELYFKERLIAAQALQPFAQRSGESRIQAIHMISSQVYLPPEISMEIQEQMRSNRVIYNIRGTFKVKASLGFGHFTYWIYGRCEIELTAPPSGVLVARNCRTKQ